MRRLEAGSDFAAANNKWGEPPHELASKRVRNHLVEPGFVPREN